MEKTQLQDLSTTILESYNTGNRDTLEQAWDTLMDGTAGDLFLFTYTMLAITHEASGAGVTGMIVVPLDVFTEDPVLPYTDVPDSAAARRSYVRLSRHAAEGNLEEALALWLLLARTNAGIEQLPAIASYALREAWVQAIVRMRSAAN